MTVEVTLSYHYHPLYYLCYSLVSMGSWKRVKKKKHQHGLKLGYIFSDDPSKIMFTHGVFSHCSPLHSKYISPAICPPPSCAAPPPPERRPVSRFVWNLGAPSCHNLSSRVCVFICDLKAKCLNFQTARIMGILAACWFPSVSNKEAGLQFAAGTLLQSSTTDEIWKKRLSRK